MDPPTFLILFCLSLFRDFLAKSRRSGRGITPSGVMEESCTTGPTRDTGRTGHCRSLPSISSPQALTTDGLQWRNMDVHDWTARATDEVEKSQRIDILNRSRYLREVRSRDYPLRDFLIPWEVPLPVRSCTLISAGRRQTGGRTDGK